MTRLWSGDQPHRITLMFSVPRGVTGEMKDPYRLSRCSAIRVAFGEGLLTFPLAAIPIESKFRPSHKQLCSSDRDRKIQDTPTRKWRQMVQMCQGFFFKKTMARRWECLLLSNVSHLLCLHLGQEGQRHKERRWKGGLESIKDVFIEKWEKGKDDKKVPICPWMTSFYKALLIKIMQIINLMSHNQL